MPHGPVAIRPSLRGAAAIGLLALLIPASASADITVTGENSFDAACASGSSSCTVGSFTIGSRATGSVSVTNGSTFTANGTSGDSYIGSNSGGNGTLTLTGTGSRLNWGGNSGNAMTVGYNAGQGSLIVSNGASVSQIGAVSGSNTGEATLYIGQQGTGSVQVSAGGTMTIQGNSLNRRVAEIIMGGDGGRTGGQGSLLVTGSGSAVTVTGERAEISAGRNGSGASGTLTVTNGASLTLNASSGDASLDAGRRGATGTVEVSGSNSTLLVQGAEWAEVTIGVSGAASSGALTVRDGGQLILQAGTRSAMLMAGALYSHDRSLGVTQGGTGRILISNGSVRISTSGGIDSSGESAWASTDIGDGPGSTGTLVVENGGTLTMDGGASGGAALTVGVQAGGNGSVTITGAGSSVTVTSKVVQHGTASDDFSQAGISGNTIPGAIVAVGGASGAIGQLTIQNGGTLSVSGNGAVALAIDPAATGTVTVSGNGSLLDAGAVFGIGALPTNGSMTSFQPGGSGTATVSDGGELRATTVMLGTSGGDTSKSRTLSVLNGGRITAQNVYVNAGGVLTGNGTVSGRVVLDGGRLAALGNGTSVGTMSIGGGLLVKSGTVEVDVLGARTGGYDLYAVTGAAEFQGGTVQVVFGDGFQPANGDRYTFLTTTQGVTGQNTLSTQANRSGVTLQVVSSAQAGALDLLIGGSSIDAAEQAATTIDDTAQEQARVTVRTIVTSVSARMRALAAARGDRNGNSRPGDRADAGTGLAAGDGEGYGISVWADGGFTRLMNSDETLGFAGYTRNLLLGADHTIIDGLVVGAVVGLERTTLSVKQNDGNRSSDGITGTAYAGYLFNDWLSADVQVGVGRLSNRLREWRGSYVSDGDFASTRFLSAANLNGTWQVDKWGFLATGGLSYARESFESYTTSTGLQVSPDTTHLGQLRFGGEVSYGFDTVTPFVSAMYEVDVRNSAGGDRNGAVLGAGARMDVLENLTAGVFGSAQLFRKDDEAYTVSANVRYAF